MKHILKQRMIINESERLRILGLHNNLRKTMGGFLHEQNMDEATKFFEDQKTKFNKFPSHGKVVAYENTFGYEVSNTDGTKYILLPNGTAVVDNGNGYKLLAGYTWTKSVYVDQIKTNPLQKMEIDPLNPITQLKYAAPRTGQEIKQDYRQQQKDTRQNTRQQNKDKRQLQSELNNLQQTYRKLQSKMTPQDKLSYETKIAELQKQISESL